MEESINWLEIVSIVSSVVSVIIGGFAIWLAVKFYEMSNKSAEKLEKASSNIEATNKRLEILFDKLYSDTFAMVKETVTDMRKHVWRNEQQPEDNDRQISNLKRELLSEFEATFNKAASKNDIEEIHIKVNELINSAVEKASNVSKDSLKQEVLEVIKELSEHGRAVTIRDLASFMNYEKNELVSVLFSLRKEELITWDGPEGRLSALSEISVTSKGYS